AAAAAHGLDALQPIAPPPQLLSQVAHVRVDTAVEGTELAAKHRSDELFARHDAPSRSKENLEQVELDRRQLDEIAASEGRARALVQLDVLDRDYLGGLRALPGLGAPT